MIYETAIRHMKWLLRGYTDNPFWRSEKEWRNEVINHIEKIILDNSKT